MGQSRLVRMELKNFTVFESMQLGFSPGINIFIGTNGTGKTHILKILYSACEVTQSDESFPEKMRDIFRPFNKSVGRLVRRQGETTNSVNAEVVVEQEDDKLVAQFSNHPDNAYEANDEKWKKGKIESAYIPFEDVLAHAPGFRSLYEKREIQFEETYKDILDRAYLPILRGPMDRHQKEILLSIESALKGKVVTQDEAFFLKNDQGELEFPLLAEGLRKLGLIWLLIQNGTLVNDSSILFWDEPEANLNPKIMGVVVDVLLQLQRLGVQIFLATHEYVILKEFDLRAGAADRIKYHSLYRNEDGRSVSCQSADTLSELHPNTIMDTFADLYDREIERNLPREMREK